MRKLDIGVWHAMLKLLDLNWKSKGYKYENLSAIEKKSINKTEFNYLVSEINFFKEEEKEGVTYN